MMKENSRARFYEVYPGGKIDMRDIQVNGDYVTATCTLYDDRGADDRAYLVCESGIAAVNTEMGLAECVSIAKNMAYENAVARVIASGDAVPIAGAPSKKVAAPATPKPVVPALSNVLEPDANPEELPVQAQPEKPTATVKKMELVAANLFPDDEDEEPTADTPPDESDDDAAIRKARDVKITILGKYHECNNLSAGQILDEHPEVIQEFAPLYSGPKEDQKKALMALYPEALRRCQQAAA